MKIRAYESKELCNNKFTWCFHKAKLVSCSKSVGFMKFQQVCENQTCCNLIQYLQTCCKLLKQLPSSLWIKSLNCRLASSLLTTCSRVVIIEPEQAMQTHTDIGLMTARQQACSRLAATGCVIDIL